VRFFYPPRIAGEEPSPEQGRVLTISFLGVFSGSADSPAPVVIVAGQLLSPPLDNLRLGLDYL